MGKDDPIYSFLLGLAYGVGLYVVGDYLLFERHDVVAEARRILQGAEEDTDAA